MKYLELLQNFYEERGFEVRRFCEGPLQMMRGL